MTDKPGKGILDGPRMIAFYPDLAKAFGWTEALIIQQVHFYNLTSKHWKGGHKWIYNSVAQWEAMFNGIVGRTTLKASIRRLEGDGVLISGNFNKFGYDKTKWYRINYVALKGELEKHFGPNYSVTTYEGSGSDLVRVKIRPTLGSESGQPIPETYTETYTESTKPQAQVTPTGEQPVIPGTNVVTNAGDNDMALPKNHVPKGKVGMPAAQVKDILTSVKKKPIAEVRADKISDLYLLWASTVPKYNDTVKFTPKFSPKEEGQLHHCVTAWGDETAIVLEHVLRQWIRFTKYVKEMAGLKVAPVAPRTDFLSMHRVLAKNYWLSTKGEYESVQLIAQKQEEAVSLAAVKPVAMIRKISPNITLKKGSSPDNHETLAKVNEQSNVDALEQAGILEATETPTSAQNVKSMEEMSKFLKAKIKAQKEKAKK